MIPASTTRTHRLRPPGLAAGVISRQRLTQRIERTAGVHVLTAPVGYGATTAVAMALAGRPGLAWVSLEARDAEPDVLASQIAGALDLASPTHLGATAGLASEDLGSSLVHALGRSGARWLVLDGLDTRVMAGSLPLVAYLCDNLPEGCGLIITTHDAVRALPFAHLTGRVEVMSAEDLALTPDELAQLALESSPHPSADQIDEVVALTEGWPAPCYTAITGTGRPSTVTATEWLRGAGADTITAAALATVGSDAARLLADTALLEQLSAPLCDAVLGRTHTSTILEDLDLRGSLLTESTPLDGDPHRWWSRRALVTVGLRRMVFGRNLTPAHRRAARWFRAEGDFEGTMRHLVQAGDVEEAGRFLGLHENRLYESGRGDSAATWYATLPTEPEGQRGWSLVRAAWGGAFTGDVRSAELAVEHLGVEVASIPVMTPARRILEGETALLTAYLAAMRGDADAVVTNAARAVDFTDDHTPTNSRQMAPLLLVRGLLLRGDDEAARAHLARLEHHAFPTDLIREGLFAAITAQCLIIEGDVRSGTVAIQRAVEWMASQGLDPTTVGQSIVPATQGVALLESGDAVGADVALAAAVDSAAAAGFLGEAVDALRWLSRAQAAHGDLAAAAASIARARRALQGSAPASTLRRQLDVQEIWVRHLAGDNVRAERLVQTLPPTDERSLLWIRVALERQTTTALKSLGSLRPSTPRLETDRQVLLATSAMRASRRLAEGHLLAAAAIASDHGLALALMGSRPELLDLAVKVGAREGHDGLMSLAQAALDNYGGRSQASVSSHISLTQGELELLRYLPSRDTNTDIARDLGISVNTVKTRLQRLYRKLGATGRDDAVVTARIRGLLPQR